MTNQEVLAVRLHIIARKSKIDSLAEVYPEYEAVMSDDEISLKARRSKLTGKASAFFRRPKIRNFIAECREELASDLNISKAEWIEQILTDAETARDDDQHMAVAKNMETVGKACGFMDTSVTVKHEHVTQGMYEARMNEELKLLKETSPAEYEATLRMISGDENTVKVIDSNSYHSDSETLNVSSSSSSTLDP